MADLVVEAVDQEADANHLAVFERMREPEEGRCGHAPGEEIIARRNIDAERSAARQQHHQHKNRNEEKPGEIAGEKVDSIKKHADHTVSFSSHAYCPQAIEVPIPDSRLLPERFLTILTVGESGHRNQSPEEGDRVSELLRAVKAGLAAYMVKRGLYCCSDET